MNDMNKSEIVMKEVEITNTEALEETITPALGALCGFGCGGAVCGIWC